jgi:predicted alpha/beta-fold hydrolase
MSDYRAPFWLPGAHLQTIAPSLFRWPWITYNRQAPEWTRWPCITYTRELWRTNDGDFIHVDWAGEEKASQLLVLFHGLEGNSVAPYARRLAGAAIERGWRFAVPHFRSCSGRPNLRLRDYHAGASREVGRMLRRFCAVHSGPVYAAGVSLGANALLKWLGEAKDLACRRVSGAVAISATLDLRVTGANLASGFGRFYSSLLLRSLRRKALEKLGRFPGAYDERRVRSAKVLRDFEDGVTAPVNRYRDLRHYYASASALPRLADIRVPTLLINALNDPFQAEHVLQAVRALRAAGKIPDAVKVDFSPTGGHGGFPGCNGWLARRACEFLEPPKPPRSQQAAA